MFISSPNAGTVQIGSSAFSPPTAPVETLAFVPARLDRPVQYRDRGSTSVRLVWLPPCPNGAVLEAYTIRCLPENSTVVPVLEVSIRVADAVPVVREDDSSSLGGQAEVGAALKHNRRREKKPIKVNTTTSRRTPASKRETKPARAPKLTASATRAPIDAARPAAPAEVAYLVDGLWPGEIYQFVVAASNRCGLGEFSRVSDYVKMESTAPDAPAKPRITNIGKRQADVEWAKPRCNGSEILQYALFWSQSESWTDVDDKRTGISVDGERQSMLLLAHSVPGTQCTLTGLLPGRPLRVWVSATNLIDNALCSSPLSPASDVERTLCDVPDASKPAPRLEAATPHSLVLAWRPPVDNGLPIERYAVVLYGEETQFGVIAKRVLREFTVFPVDCLPPASPGQQPDGSVAFTIKNLRGGYFYSADLRAVNALGAGPASDCSVPASTLPATAPTWIPAAPEVAAVTPTCATLTWKPPVDDGGAPMTSYRLQFASYSALPSSSTPSTPQIEYQSEEEDHVEEKSVFDGETTWTAACLRPKRVYRFRVTACNAVGPAAFSPWSRAVCTPSLVEFTVSMYFANRPAVEHAKARVLQVRAPWSDVTWLEWLE